ncbi:efflux RND transporter periplasmic adaptor subunit [Salinimonas lutimaris]|uniref:efflux RND transporter periplasmic adaptor subunit n=1 Tax=Salinimonas lutimaris TaxID=914153 RepID=UPI0010C003D8|nr:HlyD family secretion protein [Salinimonas lutimaris]
MGTVIRIVVTLLVVAVAVVAGRWVWDHYLYSPWTRDGRVRADISMIAPDVSGWVTQLSVKDNQKVRKGDALFAVDDARIQAAISEAQASVENKHYAWELAKHEYQRRQNLADSQTISSEDLETARINAELAKADYNLAVAQLNTQQLNLERTRVKAPADGTIVNLDLREGNYVSQGEAVLSLVKQGSFYVTGYFEETKLPLVHIGQRATVKLMSGKTELTGKVVSIGEAIADSTVASNNQLLPQIQQTFNWVRLAQRVPVDVELDPLPDNIRLVAGTTVSIHLNEQ